MRSRVFTTVATYCLLSLAGGVSLILPDSIEAPMIDPAVPARSAGRPAAAPTGPGDAPARAQGEGRPDRPAHLPCLPDCAIEHDCPRSHREVAVDVAGAVGDSGPGG